MSKHGRKRTSTALFKRLGALQRWRCAQCRQLLPECSQVDHILPLAWGGSNDPRNLQILCVVCHCNKTLQENSAPYMDKNGAMHCRHCRCTFSRFFPHQCQAGRWTIPVAGAMSKVHN